MKFSERTKMELLVGLIFCLTLIWFAQSAENSWNEKKLEELKIEKQKLEQKNEELFKEYKNETKTNIKKDSASAELNRPERGDEVPGAISGEIKEINLVEKQIREIAKENNFKWIDYLVRLAKCESTLNPKAKNVNKSDSVDRGVFQINDYWHKEVSDECCFNVACATKWTIKAINEGHQNWWTCDKIIKKNSLTALSK